MIQLGDLDRNFIVAERVSVFIVLPIEETTLLQPVSVRANLLTLQLMGLAIRDGLVPLPRFLFREELLLPKLTRALQGRGRTDVPRSL